MSINWIHFNLKAKQNICKEIDASLRPVLSKKGLYEITTDNDTQLCVDTSDVDAVLNAAIKASENHPEDPIEIRYCASTPGAYHEIIGTCKNGQIEIISDKTDLILDE